MNAPSPVAVAATAGAVLADSAHDATEQRIEFLRERSCERKWRYATVNDCTDAARRILDSEATGGITQLAVYDCEFCDGFHMTSDDAQIPGKVALVRATNYHKTSKGKRAKTDTSNRSNRSNPGNRHVASDADIDAFFAAHARNMGRHG